MVPAPYLLLVGAPGCGKSTWARRHFRRRGEVVSLDELRGRAGGDPGNQEATRYAVTAMHAIVAGRIRFDLTTVVDATNAEPEHRDPLLTMAYGWCRPVVGIVFDTPLEVCLARNRRRRGSRRVPEEVVRRIHARVREQFPVESTWIGNGFTGTAWVIHGDGMRVGGSVVMDSARYYGAADWLDEGREPKPRWAPADEKWMRFRRSNWNRRSGMPGSRTDTE